MVSFNIHGDNVVCGTQNIAGRDLYVNSSSVAEVVQILAALHGDTERAASSGSIEAQAARQAAADISQAAMALQGGHADGPGRAQRLLARARDILATAVLVPSLAEGITKAIEAVRNLT